MMWFVLLWKHKCQYCAIFQTLSRLKASFVNVSFNSIFTLFIQCCNFQSRLRLRPSNLFFIDETVLHPCGQSVNLCCFTHLWSRWPSSAGNCRSSSEIAVCRLVINSCKTAIRRFRQRPIRVAPTLYEKRPDEPEQVRTPGWNLREAAFVLSRPVVLCNVWHAHRLSWAG